MTGAQIIDAILDGAFTSRTDALRWANQKLAELWDAEEWTFTEGTDAVTVTANSQAVTQVADDFVAVIGLSRADGTPLTPIEDYRDFAQLYVGTNNAGTGLPEAYTTLGSTILVGPTSSETSATYLLIYEKGVTLLADDTVAATIPAAYHPALVSGARGIGYLLIAPEVATRHEADFQAAIAAMRRKYLRTMRGAAKRVPAYRPC